MEENYPSELSIKCRYCQD